MRRASRALTISLLITMSALTTSPAAADRLAARLGSASATVGDRIRVEVDLIVTGEMEPGAEPVLEIEDRWGEAEVLERSPEPVRVREDTDAGDGAEARYRWLLQLAVFRPGSFELPPLTAVVPGPSPRQVATEAPITLEIRSVLPVEGEIEPRPPTTPEPWPGLSPWWGIGVVLLLLALAAWLLWRRRRRSPATARILETRSPFEELKAEIEALLSFDDPEIVHTRLSLAMRRCLERALRFPAAEHTTREIRRDLRATALPPPLQQELIVLLERCDEVKFSRREVSLATTRERSRRALDLFRSLDESLRPPEPVEEAA